MNNGIQLPASLIEHDVFKRPERLRFLIWLLYRADTSGQITASPKEARLEAGVTPKQYRLWIDYFCTTGLLAKYEVQQSERKKGMSLAVCSELSQVKPPIKKRKSGRKSISGTESNGVVVVSTPTDTDVLDFEAFKDFFNKHVQGTSISPISKMSDKRKALVRARVTEYDKQTLAKAVDLVVQSDFLSGRSGKWCASFDWIFNASNFLKIIERTFNDQRFNATTNKSACRAEVGTNGIGQVANAILQRVASEKPV